MKRTVSFDLFDKPRQLKYGVNAISDLEESFGLNTERIFAEERIGLATLRAMLWVGLRHEDKRLTKEQVGDLLETYMADGGSLEELSGLVNAAMRAAGFGRQDPALEDRTIEVQSPGEGDDSGAEEAPPRPLRKAALAS